MILTMYWPSAIVSLSATVGGKHYYLHLTEEQTEAQRVDVICQLMIDGARIVKPMSALPASPGTVSPVTRSPFS